MSILKSNSERAPSQSECLSKRYGAIGPAAILAAVLAAKPKKTGLASAGKAA